MARIIKMGCCGFPISKAEYFKNEDLARLKEFAEGNSSNVYFMFNNIYMHEDALAFKGLLTGKEKDICM